jgi:hypothetical protein
MGFLQYKEEIDALGKARDDAQLALEISNSKKEEVNIQSRAQVAMIEADKVTLEQQLHQANAEIDRKEGQVGDKLSSLYYMTSYFYEHF